MIETTARIEDGDLVLFKDNFDAFSERFDGSGSDEHGVKTGLLIHGSLGTADEFDHKRNHVVVIGSFGFADGLSETIKKDCDSIELDEMFEPRHLLGTQRDVEDFSIVNLHRIGFEELNEMLWRVAL